MNIQQSISITVSALSLATLFVAYANDSQKINIDARAGATTGHDFNIAPYLIENSRETFDPDKTLQEPHFTTSIGKGVFKTLFLKNTGNKSSGMMSRKCSLRRNKKEISEKEFAIALWLDGKRLPASNKRTLQASDNTPSYVYINKSPIEREIRYKLGHNQQIDLTIGCSANKAGLYSASLKCKRTEGGQTIASDFDVNIYCTIKKKEDTATTTIKIIEDSFESK